MNSANMNLVKWPDLTDNFSHTELATNFDLIDSHDHTTGKGVQIPYGGLAALSVDQAVLRDASVGTTKLIDAAVTTVKIADANVTTPKIPDSGITTVKIADANVTTAKIASGNVTDTKLASPNNSVYITVTQSVAVVPAGSGSVGGINYAFAENGALVASATNATVAIGFFTLASTDYTVTSLTTKLRIRATLITNTVAPTSTFTIGLYPVTGSGGSSGNITYTLGTVTPGSTVASVAPASSSTIALVGSDFTFPADGAYVLGVNISGAVTAANSVVALSSRLQRHSV